MSARKSSKRLVLLVDSQINEENEEEEENKEFSLCSIDTISNSEFDELCNEPNRLQFNEIYQIPDSNKPQFATNMRQPYIY